MAIINCTPHDIVIYSQQDCTWDAASRKNILQDGATPVATIPKSGQLLSITLSSVDDGEIDGVPITRQAVGSLDIPNGKDFCIVSQLYLGAAKAAGHDVSKLLAVGTPVYRGITPQPCGVLNLQRG